ncbi:uncharacterized protein LOC121369401 [Gigantopelta aegis]|uniref:uncharacterized protein LOC121369401 n=1 Tax=Gigantopelta aegis TaxID=1735272 RepID=UPI001B88CDAF|nr:uncharacterized protein LOC121369401 [Gigantopelta aegis]
MSSQRSCLYSDGDGHYVTMKNSGRNTTEGIVPVQGMTTTVLHKSYGGGGDYSRTAPDTTRLLTVVIATSTVAFFLIIAVIVACASHRRKQKIRREQSTACASLKLTNSSCESPQEKTGTNQQTVHVDTEDKDSEPVSCCARLCCVSESTNRGDREEHIYSEVDSTSITNLPDTTDLDGIYATIDGKGSRISTIETKKTGLKPAQLTGCLKDKDIYNHLIVSRSGDCAGNNDIGIEPIPSSSPRQSTSVAELGVGSSEYDHLDYSPRTPPTQSNTVYTFDDVSFNTRGQTSSDTRAPKFVIKEKTSGGQTDTETHGYFVLERQDDVTGPTFTPSSPEVIVLSQPPVSEESRGVPSPGAETYPDRADRHDYFVVEPCASFDNEVVTRPPLPPRNRTFRTSLHGDRYISSVNELGGNCRFVDDRREPCGTLFDRSFSFESSLVSDANHIRASDEITVVHMQVRDIPVQPEVVPIRTARDPTFERFTTEPQIQHVTSFGICQAARPSSTGESQTEISQSALGEGCSRVRRHGDGHDFTVRLRDGELRKTHKCDVRRPLSFSSNEYIRRALRPKPFFEKFRSYDSASVVHRELLGIVRAHEFGKTRSSSDSACEITRSEDISTNL